VLSLTYGDAIAAGAITWRRYMSARIARLYPLFLVTTLAGVPLTLARRAAAAIPFEASSTATTLVFNAAMLPSPLQMPGLLTLFPFNAASWSIFFEMLVSIVFFLVLARLTTARLAWLTASLFACLAAAVWTFGTLDVRYSWNNIWGGFPRTGFSFCAGMILYRLWRTRHWSVSPPTLAAITGIALACVQALDLIEQSARGFAELAIVVLIFIPLAGCAAAVSDLGRGKPLATFLGDTSYAVYMTQGPVVILVAAMAQLVLGYHLPALAPWSGIAAVAAVVAVSYVSHGWFEAPARKMLRRVLDGADPRGNAVGAIRVDRPSN
jgi:peptidoglycan/LPS O-acetylase OafA/YrhL